MPSSKTVLILGANGRFGRAATHAFARNGWQVLAHTRRGTALDTSLTVQAVSFDLQEKAVFHKHAAQCTVIVNALNPHLPAWKAQLPAITEAVLDAATHCGATVMLPGNVYNYGQTMPALLQAATPHVATTKKGRLRIEMETEYQKAGSNGVQTIILRIGDFLEQRSTGNWFDTHMTKSLIKGKLIYPGRQDVAHAWGYLPDTARAMADLADIRDQLPEFTDIPFAGTTLTGEQMAEQISQTLQRPITPTRFPWWMVRLIAPFSANMREVLEMRYLWDTAHQLDNQALVEYLPEFEPTPISAIFEDILAAHRGRRPVSNALVMAQSG